MYLVLKTIKTFITVLYILIFLVIFLCKHSYAKEIRIGVASNFLMPMNFIKQNFENENKTKIYLSSGSSGSLYSQIMNGAPLDIFLSANQDFPKKLENTGKGVKGTRFTYATGKLLLFSANKDLFDLTFPNIILSEKIKYLQNAVGSVPSPFDCYMLIRSIKTLAVRMERHNSNAMIISEFLNNHKKIRKVRYPGLESDNNHKIASKQMKGFGGIISVELDSDIKGTLKFLENIDIFTLAESLGGVESLIEHPAIMTHASIEKNIREDLGISDSLVRLSIGIEDPEDLKTALNKALDLI